MDMKGVRRAGLGKRQWAVVLGAGHLRGQSAGRVIWNARKGGNDRAGKSGLYSSRVIIQRAFTSEVKGMCSISSGSSSLLS